MKQFFIYFFANLAALLFVFGVPASPLFILIVASIASRPKAQHLPFIERGSILVFDMSINVTDSPEHATSHQPLDKRSEQRQRPRASPCASSSPPCKKAAKDDRIKGILLKGSFDRPSTAPATPACTSCATPSSPSRRAGKKVYAYLEAPTTRDYYVASAASVIYLNPYGEMEMPGLASVKIYYKRRSSINTASTSRSPASASTSRPWSPSSSTR